MWSSVTERLIGTAGVSSTDIAGSSDASPRSVSKTDWIRRTDLGARNGVVADMRRDDLGSEGEKLASIDALVFGHARPLQIAAAAAGAESSSKARASRPTSATAICCNPGLLGAVTDAAGTTVAIVSSPASLCATNRPT